MFVSAFYQLGGEVTMEIAPPPHGEALAMLKYKTFTQKILLFLFFSASDCK